MPKQKALHFELGGMWEFPHWKVLLNYECSEDVGGKPCKHCIRHTMEINTRYDGSGYTLFKWTCPRVIVADNEGGYNSTGICLDCVLEAFRS